MRNEAGSSISMALESALRAHVKQPPETEAALLHHLKIRFNSRCTILFAKRRPSRLPIVPFRTARTSPKKRSLL
jgi:hypothetical protein